MSQSVVRDLRWVSDRARAELLDVVRQAWSAWAVDWLPADAEPSTALALHEVTAATAAFDTGVWQAFGELDPQGAPAPSGWSQLSERGRQELAARLVQRTNSAAGVAEGDWAFEAADLAWAALNAKIFGLRQPLTDPAQAQPDTRPWSGTVFISEPRLGAQWALCAPPAAPAPPETTTQSTVLGSVKHRTLHLAAELGEVDISLADLLSLQVGDVVRFPAGTQQGVPFKLGANLRPAGHAQLGLIDGHLALRLSSTTSARS